MRTIRVISSQSDRAKSVESAATTWNELQSDLSSHISDIGNMKAIVRETRVSLESPEAQLPQGNFTIILSMKKIASGSNDNGTRYTDAQIRELRTKLQNLLEDVLSGNFTTGASSAISEEEQDDLDALRAGGIIS
jgi:hypothetical protein